LGEHLLLFDFDNTRKREQFIIIIVASILLKHYKSKSTATATNINKESNGLN